MFEQFYFRGKLENSRVMRKFSRGKNSLRIDFGSWNTVSFPFSCSLFTIFSSYQIHERDMLKKENKNKATRFEKSPYFFPFNHEV